MTSDRPLRRGDGYVEPRTLASGETRYRARWFDGLRWRSETFADEDDAYDQVRAMARKRRRGERPDESGWTVAELLAAYLDRGAHRWSTNTVATYTLIVDRHIVPHVGRREARALTSSQVQRWIDGRTGKVSPSVLQSARTILSGAYREAIRLGQVTTNPVTGVKVPPRERVDRPLWDATQIRAVLAQASGDLLMHAWYLLALTTGMRPGELRALRWEDIDLDRGVVTVRRSMTRDARFRQVVGSTTKTGRARSVAIPDVTATALRLLRDDQDRRRKAMARWADAPVVFDRGDGHPVPQQTLHNRHVAMCEAAKVPRIRMHDLRHAAATQMLEAGVSLKVVSDVLGHASIATTADIYVDIADAAKADAANALASAIAGNRGRIRGRKRGEKRRS